MPVEMISNRTSGPESLNIVARATAMLNSDRPIEIDTLGWQDLEGLS